MWSGQAKLVQLQSSLRRAEAELRLSSCSGQAGSAWSMSMGFPKSEAPWAPGELTWFSSSEDSCALFCSGPVYCYYCVNLQLAVFSYPPCSFRICPSKEIDTSVLRFSVKSHLTVSAFQDSAAHTIPLLECLFSHLLSTWRSLVPQDSGQCSFPKKPDLMPSARCDLCFSDFSHLPLWWHLAQCLGALVYSWGLGAPSRLSPSCIPLFLEHPAWDNI